MFPKGNINHKSDETLFISIEISVDEAVRKMIRGEECQLTLQGAALEGLDKFCLPKDGSIKYEITLKKFQRVTKAKK